MFCWLFLAFCVACKLDSCSLSLSRHHFEWCILVLLPRITHCCLCLLLMMKGHSNVWFRRNGELMHYILEVHVQLQSDISVLPKHSSGLFLHPVSQAHASRLLKYFTCSTVWHTDTNYRWPPRLHKRWKTLFFSSCDLKLCYFLGIPFSRKAIMNDQWHHSLCSDTECCCINLFFDKICISRYM